MKITKPIHEIRLGRIKAAVWANEAVAGTRYNVTLSRIYKEGEQWRASDNFGRDDLLLLAKAADLAHTWIYENAADQRPTEAE